MAELEQAALTHSLSIAVWLTAKHWPDTTESCAVLYVVTYASALRKYKSRASLSGTNVGLRDVLPTLSAQDFPYFTGKLHVVPARRTVHIRNLFKVGHEVCVVLPNPTKEKGTWSGRWTLGWNWAPSSLYVHQSFTTLYLCTNEHVKLGLKRVVNGPCPTHFNSRMFFGGTKQMSENAEPRNQVQNLVWIEHEIPARFGHRFARACDVAGASRFTIISSDTVFGFWNACEMADTSFVGFYQDGVRNVYYIEF